MKFATRIQPFVSLTQKEADGIAMDQKLSSILSRTDLDSNTKQRIYQDGLARLRNYEADHGPIEETIVESKQDDSSLNKKARKKGKVNNVVSGGLNQSNEQTIATGDVDKTRVIAGERGRKSSANKQGKSTFVNKSERSSDGKDKSAVNEKPATKKSKSVSKSTKIPTPKARSQKKGVYKSYMAPTTASIQRGNGILNSRLYVRSWN